MMHQSPSELAAYAFSPRTVVSICLERCAMNKAQMMDFMKTNPACCVATVEGNKPHVRILALYRVDDDGLILQSDKRKHLHKQLVNDPEVEICFFDIKNFVEVRVSGHVEIVEDLALKKEMIEARPFEKPVVEKMGYDVVAVYRLRHGKATYWSPTEGLEPTTYVDL
jgi:uncharacterized pyridoxamine 5'-phosphate oxidase family protein